MSVPYSQARRKRRRFLGRLRLKPWVIAVVVIAVALFLGSSVVCKVLRPIRLVGNERRETAKIVRDYNSLRKENDQLRRQLAYLRTPQGIAHEARKQGLVKPGEISLVVSEDGYPSTQQH